MISARPENETLPFRSRRRRQRRPSHAALRVWICGKIRGWGQIPAQLFSWLGTGIVGEFLYDFRVFEYPECFFVHNNLIKIIAAVPHDFLAEPSKQIQNQLSQWVR